MSIESRLPYTLMIVHTILKQQGQKFCSLKKSCHDFIKRGLLSLERLSVPSIKALFSWIPGFSLPVIAEGSVLYDKRTQRKMTVIEIKD